MDIRNYLQISLTVIDNVIKGSRGSGKSKSTAIYIIYTLLKYPKMNAVCVRQNYNTLHDSCYQDLIWACERLHVTHLFNFTLSPLRITRKDTGQVIMFKGFNDPLSLTSMTVANGVLNIVWVEEAFQIRSEEAFDKLDYSIRGILPKGYFFKIIITFNPYSMHHFLYKKFFENTPDNALCWTTTYKQNPFIGEEFIKLMEEMKVNNPRKYSILGEGNWGIAEGQIITNWEVCEFDWHEIAKNKDVRSSFGLDFGYTNDPTAFVAILVNQTTKELWIFDEHFARGMTNDDIVAMIKYKGYSKERIIADSAEPKSIDDIKSNGIRRIEGARKGKDSILNGISHLQDYHIYVHESCENIIIELENYVWDIKDGVAINKPIDDFCHGIDGIRYALEVFYLPDHKVKRKIRRTDLGI